MIAIGNFFFRYRNLLFPVMAAAIFIPSPALFSERAFGPQYYLIPFYAGILVAVFGQAIRAATIGLKYILRGGKDKKVYADDLVTDGIFAHCRNPLYVGNILMLAGTGLLSNSLVFVVIVVPAFCFVYQAIVLAEENFLRGKFGDQFEDYCRRVHRWVPRMRGLGQTFASMQFNWRRYLIKEYNTLYLLSISMYLVVLTHDPRMQQLSRHDAIVITAVVVGILTALYFTIRTLKKSKRLVETKPG